jgi:ABC-type multidrug transport system fused ATPase/permease subunit
MSNPRPPKMSLRMRRAISAMNTSLGRATKPSVKALVMPLLIAYRWPLLAGIFLNAIHGLSWAGQALLMKWLLDRPLNPKIDLTNEERLKEALIIAGIYLVMSAFGRMLMWHIGYRFFTWVREQIVFLLRVAFFRHVNHLCLRFHGERASGELFSYLFGDPLYQLIGFCQHVSMGVPGSVMAMLCTVAFIGAWDPVMLALLLLTAAGSTAIALNSKKRLKGIHQEFQRLQGDITGHVTDLLRGNRAVKMYAMEDRVSEDFRADAALISIKAYQRDVRGHVENMKQEFLGYVAFALLITVGVWRYTSAGTEIGVVTAVLFSFPVMTSCMQHIATAFILWGGAQAGAERIAEVLRTTSSTPDPRGVALEVPERGDLEFRNVTFSYTKERGPVLRDLTIRIPYGQKIALVGPSGAGKSTVVGLLQRLYDPDEGEILLDGKPLDHMPAMDLRRRFGVVPQDPFIFRSTVRDNLRVAAPEASDEDILIACRRANAIEYLESLPQGLDTLLGEGGFNLSGGQRQRLAIARALLADPPFFIFDEATSALDTHSERLIQHTLDTELGAATAIFIAHRLATVRRAHRIVVIEKGRMVEDGTYEELLAKGGLFTHMVQAQSLD